MRFLYVLLVFFLHSSSLMASDDDVRTLVGVVADEKEVQFLLDNGWFFISSSQDLTGRQLSSLEALIGTTVRLEDNETQAGFQLIVEHSIESETRKDEHFTVFLPYETYTMLPTVKSIEIELVWLVFERIVFHLSDGSVWATEKLPLFSKSKNIRDLNLFWSGDDHVIVTKSGNMKSYLVNVDIPHSCIYHHSQSGVEEWISVGDPRMMLCDRVFSTEN